MSVDTHLKGKNTNPYTRVEREGLAILLAPSLVRWGRSVALGVRNWGVRKTLTVTVEHEHTGACRH